MQKYFLAFSLIVFISCGNDNTTDDSSILDPDGTTTIIEEYLNIDLNDLPDYEDIDYPIHYNNAILNNDNSPNNNPVTNKGATLGRVLFFDKSLSINNSVSCASCHQQETGFTDNNRFSTGFDGTSETTTHSMRLLNSNFYTGISFFWDKRAATLEAQTTQPIRNDVEMGFDASNGGISALVQKMNELPYYTALFEFVFGDATITESRMQQAMAQYIRSMVSVNSKFDTAFAQNFVNNIPGNGVQNDFPQFTAEENRGKQLFTTAPPQGGVGCIACHQAPTFALSANSRSNGLDIGETIIFKSPSLKNVATSAQFMHDGRFNTLKQVIAHYNIGIEAGPALDNRLKRPGTNNPIRLNLSEADQQALVAFLETLTDSDITTDAKFNDPFIVN